MKLIVLGSPGVGKGTYTQELVKELDLVHISSGDLFRENIQNRTTLGIDAEKHINAGKLVPDNLTIAMVEKRLKQSDCAKGYILDGFPRTVPQAEALEKITAVDMVLNFKADRRVIIDRLSGRRICKECKWIYHITNLPQKKAGFCDRCNGEVIQRSDDNPTAINKRLDVYQKETAPLIEFYQKRKLLREIVVNEEFGKFGEVILERIRKVINSKK